MSKYEEMSDLKIECMVSAEKWKIRCLSLNQWNNTAKRTYAEIQNGQCVYADARCCSNPSDAWPIIEMIWGRLMQVDSYYQAHTKWEAYCIEHNVGKLRAAMICFLKMKEAEVK